LEFWSLGFWGCTVCVEIVIKYIQDFFVAMFQPNWKEVETIIAVKNDLGKHIYILFCT